MVTANIPTRDRWLSPHPIAYQSSTGAWGVARSKSQVSISNRPLPESVGSASSVGNPKQTKKGKEKQTKSTPPPVPEPAAQHAEETQAEGPLGAPHLTTDDPQILLEEAEEDEEDDFIVSDHDSDEDAEGSDEDADGSDEEKGSDEEQNEDDEDEDKSDSDSDDDAIDVDAEDDEVTVDSLKERRKVVEDQIKTLREPMGDLKKKKKDASEQIAKFKKMKAKAQLDKNTFCSLKRSEAGLFADHRRRITHLPSLYSSQRTCSSRTSVSVSRSSTVSH